MATLETWALLVAIAFFVLAFGAYLAAIIWKSSRLNTAGFYISAIGLMCQSASMGWRWAAIGHPPIFGTFENALAGSWFIIFFGLTVARRTSWLRPVGLFTMPIAIATIAFGLKFDRTKFPLTISEVSLWVDIHAVFGWLAYTAYTLAFIVAVLVIIKSRKGGGPFASSLPPIEIMDDWLFKYVVYGFVAQTFMIASGAYYALIVFGRWWRWDPVEAITLVSWLLYALFIHLRQSFGWSGNRLAWLAMISMLTVITAFWLMVYWPPGTTFHVFDLETRTHVR